MVPLVHAWVEGRYKHIALSRFITLKVLHWLCFTTVSSSSLVVAMDTACTCLIPFASALLSFVDVIVMFAGQFSGLFIYFGPFHHSFLFSTDPSLLPRACHYITACITKSVKFYRYDIHLYFRKLVLLLQSDARCLRPVQLK